ncbi:MAG: hypothetical protein PHO83_00030 [Geobacteraceae bacterium]|nr:hypothetical protein [Geobacteraceae bacterium]
MQDPTKPMSAEEVRQGETAATNSVLAALLKACRSMLPLVQECHAGTSAGDSIIRQAERAIARAESEIKRGWKKHPQQKSGFFGRIGNHYDFEIHVSKTQERVHIYRYEGHDRVGRMVVVRVKKQEEPLSLEVGDLVFLRGKVQDHRLFHGEPVTYIDATSGILKIQSP